MLSSHPFIQFINNRHLAPLHVFLRHACIAPFSVTKGAWRSFGYLSIFGFLCLLQYISYAFLLLPSSVICFFCVFPYQAFFRSFFLLHSLINYPFSQPHRFIYPCHHFGLFVVSYDILLFTDNWPVIFHSFYLGFKL